MNWFGNRYNERFSYVRVSLKGWGEFETYDSITSGSLELSSSSAIKVTGSFEFEGFEPPRTDDLLRVYYSFIDDEGEYIKVPLATLFVDYSSLSYSDTLNGMKAKGSLNGQSVLKVMDQNVYGPPYTVKRHENPILAAVRMIKECDLNVEYTPTGKVLGVDYTFEAGVSYLEMVNELCDKAGYYQPFPDEYGTIQLRPIVSEDEADVEFANDDESIMYPEIEDETNLHEACNVVKMGYSSANMFLLVESKNMSGSPISLDQTRNLRRVLYESVSDIEEESDAINTLKELAQNRLREQAMKVETVTFSHAYVPMNLTQAVGIRYSDLYWLGYVENMSITLSPSIKTQTKVQREENYDILMTTNRIIIDVDE